MLDLCKRFGIVACMLLGALGGRGASAQEFNLFTLVGGSIWPLQPKYVNLLANTPIRQSGSLGSKLAEIITTYDSNGMPTSHVIVVYHEVIRDRFKDSPIFQPTGPTEKNWEGVLASIYIHEALHKCLNANGKSHDCAKSATSCEHVAIAQGAHTDACEAAGEMEEIENGEGTQQEKDDARETREGLCAGIKDLEEQWNGSTGAAAANDCVCTDPDLQACPFEPDGNCPQVKLPEVPPGESCPNAFDDGSGNGGGDVLSACENCDDL